MTEAERVMRLTGETDAELIEVLLEDAKLFVLSYTNRTVLPDALKKTVRDLAVISLNRIGTEGETSRSEGGETYTFADAPKQIYDILNNYRIARAGGVYHEATQITPGGSEIQ